MDRLRYYSTSYDISINPEVGVSILLIFESMVLLISLTDFRRRAYSIFTIKSSIIFDQLVIYNPVIDETNHSAGIFT